MRLGTLLYNVVFKRTSTLLLAAITTAFFFERGVNVLINRARSDVGHNQANSEPLGLKQPCNSTKEVLSAIRRATTDQCKLEIADVACKIDQGLLYPKSLPRYCPVEVHKLHKIEPNPETSAHGSPIRIAFVFTVNGRAIRQLRRLLKSIYSPRHLYLFHVDKRQEYLYRELKSLEQTVPNVKLMKDRQATIWGGASLLKVLRGAIKELFQLSDSWDYMINLSESDFPIKSLMNLENFLHANKGKNFVKSHGQDAQRFITKQGLDKTFYECDTHMWRLGNRQLPSGIRIDGGSDWIALNYEFCHYITFEDNPLLQGLDILYNFTLLPAESYFHTALQNSEYCTTIIDNNLHMTNWKRKQGCKCQYKHIVDWCGCSPNDFREDDWSKIGITQDKPLYFARKFEPVINQAIINQVERWIGGYKAHEDSPSYSKYWENVYSNLDLQTSFDTDGSLSTFAVLSVLTAEKLSTQCQHDDHVFLQQEPFRLSQVTVKDAHLYFDDDQFKGILISFELFIQRRYVNYELMASPKSHLTVLNRNGPIDRLIDFKVCSQFDLKEQIFRNFGCILSPFSELAAMHKWTNENKNFTVTFVWVDPANTVAGSYEIKVESVDVDQPFIVLHHKPTFKQPLRPGIWKLLLLYNWSVAAETKFLVSPLLYHNRTEIDKANVELLHNGPGHKYVDYNFTAIEDLLQIGSDRSSQLASAEANAKRYGLDLLHWAQSLTGEFWSLRDICTARQSYQLCQAAAVETCHQTPWSSFSPDLKAELIMQHG